MSWQIISAIALIVLAIVAIIKKVETRMTLLSFIVVFGPNPSLIWV